jgi:hypothetical protein
VNYSENAERNIEWLLGSQGMVYYMPVDLLHRKDIKLNYRWSSYTSAYVPFVYRGAVIRFVPWGYIDVKR